MKNVGELEADMSQYPPKSWQLRVYTACCEARAAKELDKTSVLTSEAFSVILRKLGPTISDPITKEAFNQVSAMYDKVKAIEDRVRDRIRTQILNDESDEPPIEITDDMRRCSAYMRQLMHEYDKRALDDKPKGIAGA